MTSHSVWGSLGVLAVVAVGASLHAAAHAGPHSSAGADSGYVAEMAHMHARDAPTANASAQPPRVEVQGDDVTYGTVNGTSLQGYFTRPKGAADGTLPGVVVIHEWWGLNDNIRTMARRIAGEGYAVLAVDLYNGHAATTPDSAKVLMQAVVSNPASATQNLHAAVTYLRGTRHVTKLGVLGWCFGGGWSLQTALDNPDQVNADVMYYGQPELDRQRLANLRAPLLGFFGGADPSIPAGKIHQMQTALDSLGKSVTIKIYDGAKHAFANPSGPAYDPKAAEDAWQQTTAFFKRYLNAPSASR